MKTVCPDMLEEEEIEPFIIEFKSTLDPESTAPSKRETHDFLLETEGTNLLDFLFSPLTPSLGLFETLLADASPAARAAMLYYLKLTPVVQHNITTLVPPLLHDREVMVSLASNIAYFNARGFIPGWELEYLLTQILVCPNPAGTNESVLDPRIIGLYHLTLNLIDFYRNAIVPKQKLAEEAGRKTMRKKWLDETEKQWRFHAERATWALPYESHLDPGVPLPYGCSTSAQVFTDVNELYTHQAPPTKYWAWSRPIFRINYQGNREPPIKLPRKDTDKRVPQGSEPESMLSSQGGEMFSMSRIDVEELFAWEEGQGARVQVKFPNVTDRH